MIAGERNRLPKTRLDRDDGFDGHHATSGRTKWASPYAILCGLLVVACILACRPFAELGYIDDWSMVRTARIFAQTGHFVYNGWETVTEGWYVVWAALFIRIFGYSYAAVRLSLLPVTFAAVYLFQLSLVQFRFTQKQAVFGAVTLGLSPIFLPVATSFMTDIPGLAVILLCLFLCQKAMAASTPRATILWLAAAALTNLVGGTVRQTSFLGALVMVPCAGWALRKRRGVLVATIFLTAVSAAFILAFLKWFLGQPYSVPEHIRRVQFSGAVLAHLGGQLFTAFLLLLLSVLPVLGLFSSSLLRVRARTFWTVCAALFALPVVVVATQNITPVGILFSKFGLHITLLPLIFLLAAVAAVLAGARLLISRRPGTGEDRITSASWTEIFWLLGPYSLTYFLLLLPRGAAGWIWDRYLLGLIPLAIVVLLKLHQDHIGDRVSLTAVILLVGLAVLGIGKADMHYAEKRAILAAASMLHADGVPRLAIGASGEYNSETELDLSGHINEPKVEVPAGAYRPYTVPAGLPPSVKQLLSPYTPSVKPEYFILSHPDPFLAPTKYPPIPYTTILPPFQRHVYIQAMPSRIRW